MRFCVGILPSLFVLIGLSLSQIHADTGDVESSHDYLGFPRVQGFVISDFDEDNPAEFDFPVARPLPDDANHVETVHVKGHRYVIRYELATGARPLSLFQTQQYYERLASDAGFKVQKSGAVGDVTETFSKPTAAHEIWVYLEPAMSANVLTIVESSTPPAPSTATPPVPAPKLAVVPRLNPPSNPTLAPPAEPIPGTTTTPLPASAPVPAPAPPPEPPTPPIDVNDDSLFTELGANGRIILPFVFQPGKEVLDASSQPLIDRVVAMMKRHPDLFLRIEGHTDNNGDPEDNMRLSAGRAFAVQSALVAANIDKKRLDAVGVGGLQPLATNNTAEGREKNRRIELVMWKKYPALHPPPSAPSLPSPTRTGL